MEKNAARLSIVASVIAVISMLALHVTSPEFDPSWHMVSEYTFGSFGWLLTLFFLCWGIGSWLAAAALVPLLKKAWSRVGIVLLIVAGLGAVMGGLFDARHNLHGAAFALGVPTLPMAALILSYSLARTYGTNRKVLLVAAHATWISLVFQAVTLALFISALKSAGAFHPDAREPLIALPAGVFTVVGYANRLLVGAYIAWSMVVSRAVIKVQNNRARALSEQ
ncbi:MAG: DUF998 domain-containing protein [Bacteroidota bacterium]